MSLHRTVARLMNVGLLLRPAIPAAMSEAVYGFPEVIAVEPEGAVASSSLPLTFSTAPAAHPPPPLAGGGFGLKATMKNIEGELAYFYI